MIDCPYCGHTVDSRLGERMGHYFSDDETIFSAEYVTCCGKCGAIIKWREEYKFSEIKDVEIVEEP